MRILILHKSSTFNKNRLWLMNIVQLSMKFSSKRYGRWTVQCICNEIHWTPPPVLTPLKIGTEVWMNSSRELMMMMMKKGWCYNGIYCVTFWCYDTNLSVLQHSLSLPRDGTNKYIFASCDSALLSNTWLSLLRPHSFKDGSPGVPRNFSKTINGRSVWQCHSWFTR